MIQINGKSPSAVYLGANAVSKVYHGGDIVWEKQNGLPDKFTRIAYLINSTSNVASDAYPYINTGIILTDRHKWYLSGKFGYIGGYRVFGSWADTVNRYSIGFGAASGGKNPINVNVGGVTSYVDSLTSGIIPFADFSVLASRDRIEYNGTVFQVANVPEFNTGLEAVIFGINTSGKVKNSLPVRISACKIWDGDELVREFVPVLDSETGMACMYDLVEGKAYYDARNNLPFHYEDMGGTIHTYG